MRLLLLAAAALTAGCTVSGNGKSAEVVVDAAPDVCWSATVVDSTQDGCGSKIFPVEDDLGLFSSNVQNKGEGGTVSIRIVQDGETLDEASTSAAYGIAQVIAD